MKTLALLFLTAIAVQAADITINFPPLTERQRQGLKFVADRENALAAAAGNTNVNWTVTTYNRTNVVQVLESQVIAAREGILESYAQQRDAAVSQQRLNALLKKLLTANEEQLAQIEGIVNTNTPAP